MLLEKHEPWALQVKYMRNRSGYSAPPIAALITAAVPE